MECIGKLTISHWNKPNKSQCHPQFPGCFLLVISLPLELSQTDFMHAQGQL